MNYTKFLETVIEDGIEAAKEDYKEGPKLEGSIAGFESCRGKLPEELRTLLQIAHAVTRAARLHDWPVDEYWAASCFEAEVEWTCNVVSGMLLNEGLPQIQPQLTTARGILKADEILRNG